MELDHPDGQPFCSIELVNADGSGLVDLTGDRNGCEAQPSFTPDGHRIVFERFDDATNVDAIWSMDVGGGNRRQIITEPYGVTDPNVSPDGTTLSFVDFNGADLGQGLSTSSLDGSNPRPIPATPDPRSCLIASFHGLFGATASVVPGATSECTRST